MKFGASLRNRQVIARLDKGEDFIETLKAFFVRERARSCVFTGNGFFSRCHLQTLDPDQHAVKTVFSIDSFATVPNIIGNISMMGSEVIVNASCMLVYRLFDQLHTVGGFIQDARVYSAELQLTICDDLRLSRALDPITGLVPITKIQSAYDEDYASASGILLNDNSGINMGTDLGGTDSEFPAISNLPLLSQSAPEVVHRKTAAPPDPESSNIEPTIDGPSLPSQIIEFENLETGIPGVKRRRKALSQNPAIDRAEDKAAKSTSAKTDTDALNNAAIPSKRSRPKSSAFPVENTHAINVGDWVIHPTLGKCFVQSLLPNNCVQIHTEVGSDHDISLSYFHAVRVDDVNGVPCYRLDRL